MGYYFLNSRSPVPRLGRCLSPHVPVIGHAGSAAVSLAFLATEDSREWRTTRDWRKASQVSGEPKEVVETRRVPVLLAVYGGWVRLGSPLFTVLGESGCLRSMPKLCVCGRQDLLASRHASKRIDTNCLALVDALSIAVAIHDLAISIY